MTGEFPPLSPFMTGIRCRCPQCGAGRLFDGYLTIASVCEACGLDLTASDSGDGPAVFVIFIVAPIVTALALWFEAVFAPPMWLHMVIWTPVILGASLWLLRPLKGVLVALQFRYKAGERGTRTFD